ncbi:hypothetical protein [Coleofasciculus sp. G2-EDA-02]|uniref:hypothetical protein n=1 Tax=Coleofasciculus sp. G2-EDA-02 TaxID=3069529 RepID=UPI0032FB7E2D
MKPFARQLKQMIWTIPVCLTILSPLAAQALTVKKVASPPLVNSSFVTEMAAIFREDTEKPLNSMNSDLERDEMNTVVASNATSFESKSKVYKSSGEGLLALLLLLGVPTVVIFIIANSNSSSSSRRSSSRRSSSSSYTGGIYTGGDYSGGDSGGGYSGGSDCGGGSFGGGDSGGGGAGGDF